MKYQNVPTASNFTVLRQLCNYIPPHLVPKLARETGVDEKTRTFDEWSHIVSLCYAQVTHSIGLNDVCDASRAVLIIAKRGRKLCRSKRKWHLAAALRRRCLAQSMQEAINSIVVELTR